jgi:site-specific recombinase XerD
VTLSEAVLTFLSSLPAESQQPVQQELNRFIAWYGRQQDIAKITVHGVASYAESVMSSDADPQERLGPVRDFLVYAKKAGWVKANLSSHLGIRKAAPKTSKKTTEEAKPEKVAMTQEA